MTATVPRLVIKIDGVPVMGEDPAPKTSNIEDHLYMIYFQTSKGDFRTQWIVFPPPHEKLIENTQNRERQLVLSRTQSFAGNRARWSPTYIYSPEQIQNILNDLAENGQPVEYEVVVPLEVDDLQEAYSNRTPTKALRAVDKMLNSVHNISIK